MNYCQRDKEVLWYSYFLLFLYFDTWRVNFNINIEPVKHNCFLEKCHRKNTIIRYHRCCNFRLQNILKRFDLHYIEMNWYTLCYINTHNITKLKKLTLSLTTIKTEYCTFLSADKWLVLALACFQTMAALHKNNHFIFTMSWVIFGKIIWLWKQYDFFRHFFFYFSDIKNSWYHVKAWPKKVKFFILMKFT